MERQQKKYELIDTLEAHQYYIEAITALGINNEFGDTLGIDNIVDNICSGKTYFAGEAPLGVYIPNMLEILGVEEYNFLGNVIREVENGEEKCLTLDDYEIYSVEMYGLDMSGIGLKGANIAKNEISNIYSGYELELNFPSELNGIPVTRISGVNMASNITSVVIPDSVTSIGCFVFSANPDLTINVKGYSSKPAGWDNDWNIDNYPVNWNYGG